MKKRTAYFVLESQVNRNNELRALVAVENESGYYETDWFWGDDINIAEKICDEKNLVMGITRKDAIQIVSSTFKKGSYPRPPRTKPDWL